MDAADSEAGETDPRELPDPETVAIPLDPADPTARVTGRLLRPAGASALFVFAHGAGAGPDHPFMEAVSRRLAARNIATLRYAFPYMEAASPGERGWPPDSRELLVQTVRAALTIARKLAPELPCVAGGKSLGGRMTSEAVAGFGEEGLHGLLFLGFPLHTRTRPGTNRADHLAALDLPLLFIQGTRDDLADLDLLTGVLDRLSTATTVHRVEGADHGFAVLKRSGRTDEDVLDEIVEVAAGWIGALIG